MKQRSNFAARRKLLLESLESRLAMAVATDLAEITGRVFIDTSGNGFNNGEQIAGATVNLYRDDGDGVFEATGGDTLVRPTTTASTGIYQFTGLTAGSYFVQQPAQTVSGRTLSAKVSPIVSISSTDVNGRLITPIDPFDRTQQKVTDEVNDGVPVTSSVAAPEVLGGERDLLVNKTSVNGSVQLSVNDPLLPGILSFDSILTGQGDRRVTWDGVDGSATSVNDGGLNNFDLTSAGTASGLQLQIGADLAGGQVTIRVYTNDGAAGTATRFSSANLVLPATGGLASSFEYIPFSQFVAGPGGAADFTRVGAIELEVTGVANVNGTVDLVGAVGATVSTRNFDNFDPADLSLTKTVDNARPAVGQNVRFTLTLANAGPNNATNVAVRDVLPAGLVFVSATASVGNYDNSTGLWTISALNNGSNATLQLNARVESAGTRVNTAEVNASDQADPDSTPNNNSPTEDDRATVSVTAEAIDLSLTKTASSPTVLVGQPVTFTVIVSNAGPSNATGVVVRDQLPAGITFVSANPSQGTYDQATGLWTVGAIGTSLSRTLTIVGRVDASGSKTNTAEITAADQSDTDSTVGNNNPAEDDQASVTIASPSSDLSLTKSVDKQTPNVGQTVTFTVTARNAGPDTATGVQVRDQLPSGLTFVSSAPSQGTYNQATGIWLVGSLTNSSSATLAITATAAAAGTLTNIAEVSAADQPDPDSTPGNGAAGEDDRATASINAQQIDLSISKTVDKSRPNVGDTVTFTVRVSNAGPSNATGVVVRDKLATGLVFVSATPSSGSYDAGTGQWTVGNVATGGSQTLTITARVDAITTVQNTAEVVGADQPDADSTPNNGIEAEDDQDSVSLTALTADLSLTKTVANQNTNVGQSATFTITVRNSGPDTATGIVITDRLPNGITFQTATPSQGTFDSTTGRWTVGSVTNGGLATLQLVGRVESPGNKTNTAELTAADQFDPDSKPGNGLATEDDQASVTVTPPTIDLSLKKSAENPRPNPGSVVRFNLDLANAGPSDASGVVVRDTLPTGLVFVAATPSVGTFDAATGRWTVPTLAAAASATLAIDARVTATTTVINISEIVAADQFDLDSTPNNGNPREDDYSTASITPASADLSLTKVVNRDKPNVGDNVDYTITLSNAGPDAGSGILVRDLLPPGISFVSSEPQQGTYSAATGIWDVGALAVNGTTTLKLIGRATAAGTITNTAEVVDSDQLDPDSKPDNGVASEDDQASVIVMPQLIDLSLVKTVNDDRPDLGEEITFTVVVTNAGPSLATGVTVLDTFPTGVSLRSNSATQGSYTPATGIWAIGNIAAGATVTLTLVGRVDAIVSGANVAQVRSANQPDVDSLPNNDNPVEDDQDSAAFSTRSADLSVTKIVDDATPNVGDRISFLVRLNNAGPDPATGVRLLDELSKGLKFVAATPSQGTFTAASGIWDVGQLAAESQATLLIVADVIASTPQSNQVDVARVQEADPDSTPGDRNPNEDDYARVVVTPQIADLSLQKTASTARPSLGQSMTFTVTLRNDGPDTATLIDVFDQFPKGLTFVSATPSRGRFDPTTATWSLEDLPAKQSATLVLLVTVDQPGTFTNRVEITAADQFDPDSKPNNDDDIDGNTNDEDDQASSTITVASADLSLTKTVSDSLPGLGSDVTFSLKLNNLGPDPAKSVVVRDLLPAGLTFVSSTPSSGTYDPATGNWTIAQIDPRRNATLDIVARVDTLGLKTNIAEVRASSEYDPDSRPGNGDPAEDDQSSVSLVPQLVDLALTKLISDDSPNVGDTIRYTLALSNAGPSVATQIQVLDKLPPNLTFRSYKATRGVYDPATGIWSVNTLNPDEAVQLVFEAVVGITFGQTNTAEVIAVRQPDADSTPGNADAEEDDQASVAFVTQTADLSLTNAVSNTRPNQNELLLFTITLSNSGQDTATGVVVNDALPKGVVFVSAQATSGTYNPQTGQWLIDAVPVGAPQQLQLTARVETKKPFQNTAEVVRTRQLDPDSVPGNGKLTEDDIARVTVTPKLVDLSVTGTTTSAELRPGDEVQITFTVTNGGPDDATGVKARGAIPPGMTFISAIPQRGVVNLSTGIWDIGVVTKGETLTLVLTARIDQRNDKLVPFEIIACDQGDIDSTPGNGLINEDDRVVVLVRVPPFSKRLFVS